MEQRLNRKVLRIDGMTCTGCEMRIENALKKLEGVIEVKAAFVSSNVYITYNANIIGLEQIIQAIEKLDYRVKNKPGTAFVPKANVKEEAGDKIPINRLLGIGIIFLAVFVIIGNTGFNFIPEINQSMGYGILFLVGLLTSIHCIAMCGGINLSQCISHKADDHNPGNFSKLKPGLLYNGGRVLSYTVIGGIAGALGSVMSFSGIARGIVAVICGVFMVIMGLNMLNIFPWLRKLNPGMPGLFGRKIHSRAGIISFNDDELVIDTLKYKVKRYGKVINLTPNEYKLLITMVKYPGKTFTRDELICMALGEDFDGYDRTIDTHIKNIRQKIESDPRNPKYIITVHGIGYRFSDG